MENHVLISLGTNLSQGEEMLKRTSRQLKQIYAKIIFSTIYRTPAYGKPAAPPYYNCVGYLRTALSLSELRASFKALENEAGRNRTTDDTVSLDVDIIQWNLSILKPTDYYRNYVQQGLQEIKAFLPDPMNRQNF